MTLLGVWPIVGLVAVVALVIVVVGGIIGVLLLAIQSISPLASRFYHKLAGITFGISDTAMMMICLTFLVVVGVVFLLMAVFG